MGIGIVDWQAAVLSQHDEKERHTGQYCRYREIERVKINDHAREGRRLIAHGIDKDGQHDRWFDEHGDIDLARCPHAAKSRS